MALLSWILFALLLSVVQTRLLAPLDEVALRWVVAHRPEALADLMNWIFRLGFAQVDAAVAVAWSAYLLLQDVGRGLPPRRPAPMTIKAAGQGAPPYTSRFPRRLRLPALAPLVLFAAIGLQAGLRLVVDQPAPGKGYELHRVFASEPVGLALDRADALVRESFVAAVAAPPAPTPNAPAPERGSFPSGHATRVLFLALLAAGWRRGNGKSSALSTRHSALLPPAAALLLSALVGYSALYFGYHWPSDLLGGYLLALALYPPAAWLRDRTSGIILW